MTRLSSSRLDMETKRVERPVVRYYAETYTTVAATASTTLDISTGNTFKLTQNTNITTLTVSNPTASGTLCFITIIRVKDNSGSIRSITWPAAFKWAGGTQPNLSTSANGVDIITAFTIDAGTTWYAFNAGASMA